MNGSVPPIKTPTRQTCADRDTQPDGEGLDRALGLLLLLAVLFWIGVLLLIF